MMYGRGKSDLAIVVRKPTNKAGQPVAEPVERRAGAEGTAGRQSTLRAQNRERVTQALDRVRQAARQRKKERFTTLLHHISVDLLRLAFFALKRDAAAGVDGLSRKYKRFQGHIMATWGWLRALKRRNPSLFAHWALGPSVG